MNRKHLPGICLARVILVAALAVGGVRGTAWVYVLIGLACPLMMVLMMGDMHGSGPAERPETAATPTRAGGPARANNDRGRSGRQEESAMDQAMQ